MFSSILISSTWTDNRLDTNSFLYYSCTVWLYLNWNYTYFKTCRGKYCGIFQHWRKSLESIYKKLNKSLISDSSCSFTHGFLSRKAILFIKVFLVCWKDSEYIFDRWSILIIMFKGYSILNFQLDLYLNFSLCPISLFTVNLKQNKTNEHLVGEPIL